MEKGQMAGDGDGIPAYGLPYTHNVVTYTQSRGNAMKYKGYEAVITYEEDINAFHGRVRDIRDVVSFEGSSIEELEREFQASLDDYLAMCANGTCARQ